MAYENTLVAVSKSQGAIRKLILRNAGTGVAFVSQPPREGFEAQISLEGKTYHIRIMATCREMDTEKKIDQEERRVWRVLFYHMKGTYAAAESGVLEIRDLILPYIVVQDGKTISEHIAHKLEAAIKGDPSKLLPKNATIMTD